MEDREKDRYPGPGRRYQSLKNIGDSNKGKTDRDQSCPL